MTKNQFIITPATVYGTLHGHGYLHPQAQLTTGGTASHPVLAAVEDSCRGNSSDTITPELGQLVSGATVDINKTVHVSDTESLNVRLRVHLPARTKAKVCGLMDES